MTHKHRNGDGSSDEYATPPWLWRKVARPLDGFDVDPASGAESTPIAETRYTVDENGLEQSWEGGIWLNPPFGDKSSFAESKREDWLVKARQEVNRDEVRTVTVLLPVDTSTSWFHEHVVEASIICFLNGRIEFEGEKAEATGNTSFASSLAVFGDPPEELANVLEDIGAVFRGREFHRSTVQTTLGVKQGADP
jgi:phage N-6-adenine-methyltransferase